MYELNKKTISTLIMTILMLSMALAAMPTVGANPGIVINSDQPLGVKARGPKDIAGWSTEYSYKGSWSFELSTPEYHVKEDPTYHDGAGEAYLKLYFGEKGYDITLSQAISNLSWLVKSTSLSSVIYPVPHIQIAFVLAEAERYITYEPISTTAWATQLIALKNGEWVKFTAALTDDAWHDDSAAEITSPSDTDIKNYADLKTAMGFDDASVKVKWIKILLAPYWPQPPVSGDIHQGQLGAVCYIDDVTVGGVLYALEGPTHGPVGTETAVSGYSVTAGGMIQVYWDSVKPWDGTAGFLAEEYAVGNSFSIDITIPEAKYGEHILVVKDVEASETKSTIFTVESKITLDPKAGIPGDAITVKGTGFEKSTSASPKTVGMTLISVKGEKVGIGDGLKGTVSGDFKLSYKPADPSAVKIYVAGTLIPLGSGPGQVQVDADGELDFTSAPASGAVITADYTFETPVPLTISPYGLETSSLGSFTATFAIPDVNDGTYTVKATAGASSATASLTVGICVTLTPKKGLPGTTVTVSGRGFKPSRTVDIIWTIATGYDLLLVNDYPTDVYGEFTATITVPLVTTGKVYTVKATDTVDSTVTASATFTATGTTAITITPKSGLPGTSVTVEGEWFTGGKKVTVYFDDVSVGSKTAGTIMPYEFTLTITIPATATYGAHTIKAMDSEGVYATATFTVSERKTVLETRSTTYMPGDTISFNIYSTVSFKKTGTVYDDIVIKIGDPDGYLFWSVKWKPEEDVSTATWVVPYSAQTETPGFHLTLPSDAKAGLWKWNATYYLSDVVTKIVKSGSFTVKAVTASMIDEKIAALEESINLLGVQIQAAQEAAEAAQAAADAAGTKATAAETAAKAALTAAQAAQTAATAAQTAATTAGTKADAALTAAQAATTAAQAAKTSADSSTAAANAAKASADAAKAATDGLTTLVYVAIAASIVAALASVFAVMQIGKKIA